ncbi:protein kinase [Ectocarpus siliculosus]|uniref:Protein kinase n=1 Tax=Ectocarpus siliculosus TaxID=2880 RepID=D7FLN5_ECTSI|nr:protein kinase [Ectocarpus siliculosus]|eukprot:CBJ25851.1 protein kinase [Ectocarpus siliculosus]
MVTREPKVLTSTAPAAVGTVVQSSRAKTEPRSGKDNDRAPAGGGAEVGLPTEQSPLHATNSTANVSTGERNDLAGTAIPPENDPVPGDGGAPSMVGARRTSDGGVGYGQAVMAAAQELAQHCQIPGVSEAATAVSILVRLVSDSRDYAVRGDAGVKRCRSIVMMLELAAKVLGKGGDTNGEAAQALMEDVHDAVCDLVELIKTYQSKNRLSNVLMSTLFKRRQDELDAVVDRAILRLHLGLQVQVGHDVSEAKEVTHRHKGSMEEAMSEPLAEARSARRQRRLDQLAIPEDHVLITDEVLGKGGFGEVFIADYNGRNAAAKVQHVAHGFGRLGEDDLLNGASKGESHTLQLQKQRKAFLHELDAMVRLRSPHTVNVYGAITSLLNRPVLVMELLAGGDLRSMLKRAEPPLPEAQCRQIIGDICAGMAFLHCKIGDFGTSRWAQNTENSTGLATYTTKTGHGTHISFAWTAPEVLKTKAVSNASDVYSFGVVVWEILTRQIPWAEQALPTDIYLRVVIRGERPISRVKWWHGLLEMVRMFFAIMI